MTARIKSLLRGAGQWAAAAACAWLLAGPAGAAQAVPEISFVTWTKAQYPVQYEEALGLAAAWKKLGITLKIEPLNFPNPLLERIFKVRDFDAAILFFTSQLERLDPDFYTYNAFHSSRAVSGGWNFSGLSDPDLDRLLEAQREEYDLTKRKAIVDKIQRILFDRNVWLVMVNQDELEAYNKSNFNAPVLPKVSGFSDPMAFFKIQPIAGQKVVRWGSQISDLKTINPIVASESSQVRILYLVYDTLMKIGPDTQPMLWAAKEVKPTGPTTIEVTIRDGLTFHDGVPLTAEDVKYSFDFLIKNTAAYYNAALEPVAAIKVVSPTTVEFTLKRPYAPFTTQTLAMVPLLPKHVWEKIEKPAEYENVPPIGSGPFKFDHWKHGQEFAVTRFADHFSPPPADGVLIVFYGTREAAYTALVQKEVDVMDRLLAHQVDELKSLDYIQTVQVPSTAADTIILNIRNKPFNDPKLRAALNLAIPRKEFLDQYYEGYGTLGASVLAPADAAWSDTSIKPPAYDIEAAKAILKEAGYHWDADGHLLYPE
ncbi:MAG: ABC transporter substrate-binding protein [Alphaproteobacteria bacterium]